MTRVDADRHRDIADQAAQHAKALLYRLDRMSGAIQSQQHAAQHRDQQLLEFGSVMCFLLFRQIAGGQRAFPDLVEQDGLADATQVQDQERLGMAPALDALQGRLCRWLGPVPATALTGLGFTPAFWHLTSECYRLHFVLSATRFLFFKKCNR